MLRKKLLFWLVWLFLAPLVVLYYCLAAITTGRWRTIFLKTRLVYQSVWEQFVTEKPIQRQRVDRYGRKR